MKNLKTIVALLVLTVLTFSCQTNDELVELETLNEFSNKGTTEILVIFSPDLSEAFKKTLEKDFSKYINILNTEKCTPTKTIEDSVTWTVEGFVSFGDLSSIARMLGYIGNGETVLVVGDVTDSEPDDGWFLMYYDANCTTNIY